MIEPESDVSGDGEQGQQPRLLEDHADLLVRGQNGLAVERDAALRRRVEAADGAQQGGLATARAADHGDDLADLDIERHAVERMHAVCIGLADAVDGEHQASCCRAPKESSQRSNGLVTATTSQSVSLPRIAKATMAATICAGLPSCWPSMRRKPSPVEAPRNSAATTNIQPSPSPARSEMT